MKLNCTLLLISTLASSGCHKPVVKPPPPEDVIIEEARKQLERSPVMLSTLCGINVSGLQHMVVTVVKSEGSRHEVKVEGTAILNADGGAPEGVPDGGDDGDDDVDAGKVDVQFNIPRVLSPGQMLRCTGVVALTIEAIVNKDHVSAGWESHHAEVLKVTTAGVGIEKAVEQHHHHHHHHH